MLSVDSVERICQLCALGAVLAEPKKIYTGLLHEVWQLQTSQGFFAVKVIAQNHLNPHILPTHVSEEIAALMQQNGIPTVTAKVVARMSSSGESRVVESQSVKEFPESTTRLSPCGLIRATEEIVVMPWIVGQKVSVEDVTPEMAKKIGALLAKIHLVNLSYPKLEQLPFKGLPKKEWCDLIYQVTDPSFKDYLNSKLSELVRWSKLAEEAIQQLSDTVVFSHRDFDNKNVLWHKGEPILLDWEYAGLIHPDLDLFIVALNWSGVQYGFFKKENFDAVINSFGELTTSKLTLQILHLYFGYCLDWLIFNLRQFIASSDEGYFIEVNKTYQAIKLVEKLITAILV